MDFERTRALVRRWELCRFGLGIYYIPDGKPFNAEKVIFRKYIQPRRGAAVGYYTGEKFLYDNGLIADVPERIEICTHVETVRMKEKTLGGKLHLVFRKPRNGVVIDDDNIPALQLLDLFTMQDISFFSGGRLEVVRDYIYNYGITPDEVFPYLKYYPDRTAKALLLSGLTELKFKT